MYFSNKIIWITGASSGIGKALAIALSKQQCKLILSSRNIASLELVKVACEHPQEITIIALDLENFASLELKAQAALKAFGKIDILIHNGGVSQRSLVIDTHIDVDKRIMDVNYLGTIALTKAILPHFIQRKAGQFVVTTSIVGKIGTPLRSSYAASKHALHGFFDSLRAENYQNNIAVTLVCPGFINTNISKNALTGNGTPQGKMDTATGKGMSAARCAKLMLKAMKNKKEEVYIAGAKEKLGVLVKRFFPRFFSILIRKMRVT
jgi:dehydrogenase/reductase SDR family protein 7B